MPRKVLRTSQRHSDDSDGPQVDVRALKESIWECTQQLVRSTSEDCPQPSPAAAQSVSFQDLLSRLRGGRAGRLEDLSVHLAFICVLHLANEHGLAVRGVATLDAMTVSLP
jgi:condensin complex subunit 2